MIGACGSFSLLATRTAEAASPNILFVGNSFTYGNLDPAASYNASAVTDLDGTNYGGVPGIFKKMTDQSGFSYNVSIEAVPSIGLDWHYANKSSILSMTKWNNVVLQEYSTRPTPSSKGGDPSNFYNAVGNIRNLIAANSNASISLYETWARPDQVFPGGAPYAGQSLQKMQSDLHNSYVTANANYGLAGISEVGDAFMRAIADGVANPNPYQANPAGTVNLWYDDDYHASAYGFYLAGAVIARSITGLDPRALPTGSGSAAAGLGISSADAARLDNIAYEAVSAVSIHQGSNGSIDGSGGGTIKTAGGDTAVPEPASAGVLIGIAAGQVLSGRRRRRD